MSENKKWVYFVKADIKRDGYLTGNFNCFVDLGSPVQEENYMMLMSAVKEYAVKSLERKLIISEKIEVTDITFLHTV